jgi:hypothetical protein
MQRQRSLLHAEAVVLIAHAGFQLAIDWIRHTVSAQLAAEHATARHSATCMLACSSTQQLLSLRPQPLTAPSLCPPVVSWHPQNRLPAALLGPRCQASCTSTSSSSSSSSSSTRPTACHHCTSSMCAQPAHQKAMVYRPPPAVDGAPDSPPLSLVPLPASCSSQLQAST